jgi:hypothetical protein
MYGRHSRDAQSDGTSEERQVDLDEQQHAATELGCDFNELPYYDRGLSGFYGDNLEGDLGRIKDDIESGKIRRNDVLNVESHSRIGRLEPGEAIMQYLGFLRAGIRLRIKGVVRTWKSIGGEAGMPILIGDFIEIYAAHQFSVQLSNVLQKTNRIKRDKLLKGQKQGVMKTGKAGLFVGKRCPAWLYPLTEPGVDGYMYAIKEQIAAIVRMIFQWADEGDGGMVIAQRLNAMGTAPLANYHRRKPEKMVEGWCDATVLRLLRNIAVIGLYQPRTYHLPLDEDGSPDRSAKRQKFIEGDPQPYYPPLFPDDPGLFQRVQRKIDSRNRHQRGRDGVEFGNIFKGLGACDCCGGTLSVWRNTKGIKYVRCENYRTKVIFAASHKLAGQRCTNKHGFRYAVAENMLWDTFDARVVPILAELVPVKHDNDILERRLSQLNDKLAKDERGIRSLAHQLAEANEDDYLAGIYRDEIATIRASLAQSVRERDRLDEQKSAAHHESLDELAARVQAAKAKLESADQRTRYETRKRLNAILHDRLNLVLLTGARAIILIKGFKGSHQLGISFTRERFLVVMVFDAMGRETNSVPGREFRDWPIPRAA